MTKIDLKYPPGSTPLEVKELEGLIPQYITTQSELNELEHRNIQDAHGNREKISVPIGIRLARMSRSCWRT